MSNPFYNRGPIRDTAFFFDRQAEVQRALGDLMQGQSIAVIGQRKIGKTSFLHHISLPETLAQQGIPSDQYLFAFIDCQGLGSQGADGSHARIIEAIEEKLPPESDDLRTRESERRARPWESLRQLIRRIWQSGLHLVIMLDEFDHMLENPSLDLSFFSTLRSLVRFNVAFVTATLLSPMRARYMQQTKGSPFLNIFIPLWLGLFEPKASRDMVHTLAERGESDLDGALLDWIVRVGGNHPFLTQVAGYWAWQLRHENGDSGSRRLESRRLESHDMERLQMVVYDDMEAHFLYCWHHLAEGEQEALASLPSETLMPAMEQLIKLGLVVEQGGQYQIFSPLFETFVRDRAGLLRLDLPQRQVYVSGRAIDLTPSHYAALRLLAAHPGRLVSYKELAQEVWPGECYEGSERTKVRVSKLRERLGPAGKCIENRRGFGYVLELAGIYVE